MDLTPEAKKMFFLACDKTSDMFIVKPENRLEIIAELAARAMGCSRCCIFLASEKDKMRQLRIAAGYPKEAHPVGFKLTPKNGKLELEKIMDEGNIVPILDSRTNKKIAYMRTMIFDLNIKKQLMIPLYFKKLEAGYVVAPFGIMILDAVGDEIREKFDIDIAKKVARLAVNMHMGASRRCLETKELINNSQIKALNEHGEGLQESLIHTIHVIGGSFKRLLRYISSLEEEFPDHNKIKTIKGDALMILEEISKFSGTAENILQTIKFCKSTLTVQKHNLYDFLQQSFKETCQEISKEKAGMDLSLNCKKISKKLSASFDSEQIKYCVKSLLYKASRNSGTGKIGVTALIRNGKSEMDNLIISVSYDGKPVNSFIEQRILKMFISAQGEKGLALTDAIIKAHDGSITPFSNSQNKYVIRLPLK